MNSKNKNTGLICNWCGNITSIIWVHGHGQCKVCGTNIDECCNGEVCEPIKTNANTIQNVSKSADSEN